jgi:cyanate permease
LLNRTHWPAVWAAIATGVIAAAYVGKLPPAIPLLRDEFGLSLIAAGWVNSIFNTLSVCTAAFVGVLAGRFGPLRFCGAGLATMMLGGTLGAAAQGEGQLLASRLLEGGGFIAISVSVPALIVAACAPRERNLTLGLWASYMPLGSGLAILASPFLLGSIGWRGLWLAIVLMMLACTIVLWRFRGSYRIAPAAAPALSITLRLLRQAGLWWLALGFACYSLMYFALAVWLPTYLIQERGASIKQAALLTALLIGCNAGGNLLGGWLMHRAAARGHVISLAFLIMAACSCGIFSVAPPDAMRFFLCAIFMLTGGMIPASILSGGQVYARDASQISGIQGLIVQVAQIGPFAGPPLIAAVVSAAGNWEAALGVLLAAAALGTLFGQLALRAERALPRTTGRTA